MRYQKLGKTDLQVSELALGGLYISSLGGDYETAKRAFLTAIDHGINYVDTAPAYADSEAVLGRILRETRADVIISTKLGGRPKPFNPRDKKGLMASVEESLRLLGREAIDILMVHEPDRPGQYDWWTDVERVEGPVLEVLDDLKRQGKIRYTGLGGTTSTELAHYVRSGKFDVVLTAFNFSLLYREAVYEILPAARERNMGVILGSVLQQGALGRRYDEVVRRKPIWLSKPRQEQFLALYSLLDELGLDLVETGLRFAVGSGAGHTVLIGARTPEHVQAAVEYVSRGPLPAEVLQRLDAVAAMVPFRPFEEPMILPFKDPDAYRGPGPANLAVAVPVGKL